MSLRMIKTLKALAEHESVLSVKRSRSEVMVCLMVGWTHFDGGGYVTGLKAIDVVRQFNEGKICRVSDLKRAPKEIVHASRRRWHRDGAPVDYIVTYRMHLVGVDELGPTYKPTEVLSETGRPPWETGNPMHTQMGCSWASMGERPAEYGLTAADVAGIPERYADDKAFQRLQAVERERQRLVAKAVAIATCTHPIEEWIHGVDEGMRLRDFYNCGRCGELMQVG